MLKIREYNYSDQKEINKLSLKFNMGESSSDEERNRFENNPVLESIDFDWPKGWVMETEEGSIVGVFRNVPSVYYFRGGKYIAAIARGWIVDIPYRQYSLLLLNKFMAQKKIDFLLDTTASVEAEKVLVGFKCKRVPVSTCNQPLFWILDYSKFIKSYLKKKNKASNFLICFALSQGLRFKDMLLKKNKLNFKKGKDIELLTDFDSEFDGFWEELLKHKDNSLIADRSAKTLRWHYKSRTSNENLWILKYKQKNKMVAYMVLGDTSNKKIDLNRINIFDYQCIANRNLFLPLLKYAVGYFSNKNIHVVESIGFTEEIRDICKITKPYSRQLPSFPFLYKAKNMELESVLSDSSNWCPCDYDGDASL